MKTPRDTELLRLEGVRKSFGDNVVLRDVDLAVEPGQCVVLIGASGSGKSTLLRCVNLLEVVDDGVITFDGRDITDPRVDGDEVRARMGMVFQAYNLFPHMSVLDNITLAPRKVHALGRRDAAPRPEGVFDSPYKTLGRLAGHRFAIALAGMAQHQPQHMAPTPLS